MIEGFVYFIWPVTEKHESIKIGFSIQPDYRLWTLNYCTPFQIEVAASAPGTRKTEQNVQDCFAHCHRWNEWFHPHPDLLGAIEKLRAGVPLEEAVDLSKRTGRLFIGNRKNRKHFPNQMVPIDQTVAA